jgi:hypothetical protein
VLIPDADAGTRVDCRECRYPFIAPASKAPKSRFWTWVLVCFGATALCLCGGGGTAAWRYFGAGVNPFREWKFVLLGESIQVKDIAEPDGRIQNQLLVDGIHHGGQFLRPPGKPGPVNWSRLPTAYYHAEGPVGMVLAKANWFGTKPGDIENGDARPPASLIGALGDPSVALVTAWSEPPMGVVMMNVGTHAAYGRPLQTIDFYERDAKIRHLSDHEKNQNPTFTYIADARKRGANVRFFDGNERKTLETKGPTGFYHFLFVDTSHGHPGLPAKEVLTKEALQSMINSLAEEGIIAFHTSSRDYDLPPLIASASSELKLANLIVHDKRQMRDNGHFTSEWIFVARKAMYLTYVEEGAKWRAQINPPRQQHERIDVMTIPGNPAFLWTDGGSNSLVPFMRKHGPMR